MTLDQREHYEERAAIAEHDAGMSREEAEAFAWQRVMGEPMPEWYRYKFQAPFVPEWKR